MCMENKEILWMSNRDGPQIRVGVMLENVEYFLSVGLSTIREAFSS